MTKAGFTFIIAGVFVYFLASQTQVGWLYLFDAVIWSLLLLSAIIFWFGLKSLKIERHIVYAGSRDRQLNGPLEDEPFEVRLKVSNRGHLARYFIKVLEDCPFDGPEKQERTFLISKIGARSSTGFTYLTAAYRRGYYQTAGSVLQFSDPLGLIIRRRSFQLPLNLTVYPAYYPMKGLPAADAYWSESGAVVKSRSADEFHGSRQYQYGDPLKHVHWRSTARVGHFMLKEFERTSYGSLMVIFAANDKVGTGKETTLEYSIKVAASLSKLCAESERTIDIIAGEQHLSGAGWRESMDFLARLESGEAGSLMRLPQVAEPGQTIVVIGTGSELAPAISQLSGRVKKIVAVLLRGFYDGEIDNESGSKIAGINSGNIDIVTCRQGNLEEAIVKLNSYLTSGLSIPVV